MKATIIWFSETVVLDKRAYLFCFKDKCMSGRIEELVKLSSFNEYKIFVEFINPDYFKDELVNNNNFTINEASRILGEGRVEK